jgi:hypothetical protein
MYQRSLRAPSASATNWTTTYEAGKQTHWSRAGRVAQFVNPTGFAWVSAATTQAHHTLHDQGGLTSPFLRGHEWG